MPLIDSFKAGDTEPTITHTIEGLAQDASEISDVILYMSPEDQEGLQINNSVDDFSPANDGDAVSIEYQLSSDETSIADRHQVEFVVQYSSNLFETFPKSSYDSIQVAEPLERDGEPIEVQTDHDMDRLGVDELGSQSGNGVSVTDNFDFGGNNVSGVGSLGVGGGSIGNWYFLGSNESLQDAVDEVSNGDVLVLSHEGNYSDPVTISKRIAIWGGGTKFSAGATIDATLTLENESHVQGITIGSDAVFNIDGDECAMIGCALGNIADITVTGDRFRFVGNHRGTVVFESGTSNGIVAGCVETDVTDNGSNTVGIIDGAAGQLSAPLDFGGNNATNVGSLDADTLDVGGNQFRRFVQEVDAPGGGEGSTTVSFSLDTPLGRGEEMIIELVRVQAADSPDSLELTCAEYAAGSFWYQHLNSAPIDAADSWTLVEGISSAFQEIMGIIVVSEAGADASLNPNIAPGENSPNGLIASGGANDTGGQNFTFELTGSTEGFQNCRFKVWRRDKEV